MALRPYGPTLHKSMRLHSVAFVHTPGRASEIENLKVGPKEKGQSGESWKI